MSMPMAQTQLNGISNARLPVWALPADWPMHHGEPLTADIGFADGMISSLSPTKSSQCALWNLDGALVLPGLIEPHAHLDKTFTIGRSRPAGPGLLAAIDAMQQDRWHWNAQDIHQRAAQGLARAAAHGVSHLRTHIDWFDATAPAAWLEMAKLEQPGVTLERVALVPLVFFADAATADAIAQAVAHSGEHGLLGGFIHSSNWDPAAMENLMLSAARWHLNLDLHIDEELGKTANGLVWLAEYLSNHEFPGHICCSHGCALASGGEQQAKQVLALLAKQRVTLIALPMTNLLLQDAVVGRTPRQRGITLLKEAQTAGVPTLLGCDNVQDAFCPAGSYDPLDTLTCGMFAAQLEDVFDQQSRLICDLAVLTGATRAGSPLVVGNAANIVIFPGSDRFTWPLNSAARLVINHGKLIYQRMWDQEHINES
ncbi:cytosine deaminase [Acerihabitans sp. TG2]|uniref:cytosine deaminase n=1 Tax=Acerihabitans sp. TG2 TaxID=3096008 RepID=UPI002B224D50|nr:cytosine deaminase [Acerihabitans sp. TG2]MEA9391576.1 cytosine deaminase [Acerihabitans sp. TG2]